MIKAMHYSLLGYNRDDDTSQLLEISYNNDIQQFGPIDQIVFYDILFNYFDCWSDFIDSNYLTVFSWALLDAVLDIKSQPPKFKPIREITRFTKVPNEASMYESYLKNKRILTKFTIQEESMNKVGLTQRNFLNRKTRASFSGNKMLMLEAIKRLSNNKGAQSQQFDDESSSSDSDDKEFEEPTNNKAECHVTITMLNNNEVQGISDDSRNPKSKGRRQVLPFARNSTQHKGFMELRGTII